MSELYRFVGQEESYVKFRPNWAKFLGDTTLAEITFHQADISFSEREGWIGAPQGKPPKVAIIAPGPGPDAAVFKQMGCSVILVDPNKKFLDIARQNLARIEKGRAKYNPGDAMHTGITLRSVDFFVAAQAAHTLKQLYAAQFLDDEQKETGLRTEEITRQHWMPRLRNNKRRRIVFPYYNPDPRVELTHVMHEVLLETCPEYAKSNTPLLKASFFDPRHLQPWMLPEEMIVSNLFEIQTVTLQASQIHDWLNSYSFRPSADNFGYVVGKLREKLFDPFQKDGILEIPYVAVVVQAPLRKDAFDMTHIDRPIAVTTPLNAECPTARP